MNLTIGGKKYTFVYSVAATLDDDLLETVTNMVKVTQEEGEDASLAIAGKLPILTKALFYGGLLQLHGEFGDGSVKSHKDADRLLFQYMTENEGKKEASLINIFNSLYTQMGDDNFLSRIGMISEEKKPDKAKKATPTLEVMDGGAN